jgi:homoserine acetyltransferase
MSTSPNLTVNWTNVPTRAITAGGVEFAYRELGANNPGTPVVFLIHLAAVLDNWDPRVVDGFATSHHVITFDKQFLFFTRTPGGIRAGKEFLARLSERFQNRDKEITVTALQAQLKALRRWGSKAPADLSKIQQPVLVANGDSDRMLPSNNTHDLARRLPNSDLIIYPDAGHGGVFQYHPDFVPKAREFLAR